MLEISEYDSIILYNKFVLICLVYINLYGLYVYFWCWSFKKYHSCCVELLPLSNRFQNGEKTHWTKERIINIYETQFCTFDAFIVLCIPNSHFVDRHFWAQKVAAFPSNLWCRWLKLFHCFKFAWRNLILHIMAFCASEIKFVFWAVEDNCLTRNSWFAIADLYSLLHCKC